MSPEYKIIFEDDKMLICDKPAGVLAQSGKSFDVDMVSALMMYRRKKGESAYIGVINRLDRPVSGLMVFAKTQQEASHLNKMLQQNTFNKQYYAVVCGKPAAKKATLVDYLLKDAKANISSVVAEGTKDAKKSELEYEVIAEAVQEETQMPISLIKIHLITGRHHQIRVQFASRSMPLLGDTKYATKSLGGSAGNTRSIALCAYALDIASKHFEVIPDGPYFEQFSNYFMK